MTLNEKLATIQTKFKSKKSRYNSFGKYYFRSAEDILEATKPYLLELGVSVTVSESIIAAEPFPIMESKATVTDGESAIHATAVVGVDLDQKGMQMPQKFGSASSYGKKYRQKLNLRYLRRATLLSLKQWIILKAAVN
jgi:hypothetical protein